LIEPVEWKKDNLLFLQNKIVLIKQVNNAKNKKRFCSPLPAEAESIQKRSWRGSTYISDEPQPYFTYCG
jgi:hypothetical protein